MKFFVTYAGADAKWAEWIVWELENNKPHHACIAQFRDLPPGPSFIDQVRAATEEQRYNFAPILALLVGDRALPLEWIGL
jgi:TIR domain